MAKKKILEVGSEILEDLPRLQKTLILAEVRRARKKLSEAHDEAVKRGNLDPNFVSALRQGKLILADRICCLERTPEEGSGRPAVVV